MKHLDILINILTLLSGIITVLLGHLLYLKYRIKAIQYYSFFILTTTLAVVFTTVDSYLTNIMNIDRHTFTYIMMSMLFQVFLVFINYAFTLFSLGIINKPLSAVNLILIGIPCIFTFASFILIMINIFSKHPVSGSPISSVSFAAVLSCLFIAFILNSIKIAKNLKNILNSDLQKALKIFAMLFLIFIPVQALIIALSGQWMIIMISRNLFYLSVNIISIIFAGKYFFLEVPSIIDKIEISRSFIDKYSITSREKEVIELLSSGLTIKEIAGRLDRSFKTINNHIYNIYKKTNVGNKLELLNLIRENRF